jgi:hypothetical protein
VNSEVFRKGELDQKAKFRVLQVPGRNPLLLRHLSSYFANSSLAIPCACGEQLIFKRLPYSKKQFAAIKWPINQKKMHMN